jgi:hypothetical protein
MNFIRRLYHSKMVHPYTKFNELSIGRRDGYYIYVNVCHDTKRIYFNESMTECEKKNDLPKIVTTFLSLYPRYVLYSGDASVTESKNL